VVTESGAPEKNGESIEMASRIDLDSHHDGVPNMKWRARRRREHIGELSRRRRERIGELLRRLHERFGELSQWRRERIGELSQGRRERIGELSQGRRERIGELSQRHREGMGSYHDGILSVSKEHSVASGGDS